MTPELNICSLTHSVRLFIIFLCFATYGFCHSCLYTEDVILLIIGFFPDSPIPSTGTQRNQNIPNDSIHLTYNKFLLDLPSGFNQGS